MKYFILPVILSLSGCSILLPVKPEFPKPVPELMKKCEDLKKVEGEKVAITDMLKVVVNNYTLYYQCSAKVDGWQDWYTEQKNIYDSAK